MTVLKMRCVSGRRIRGVELWRATDHPSRSAVLLGGMMAVRLVASRSLCAMRGAYDLGGFRSSTCAAPGRFRAVVPARGIGRRCMIWEVAKAAEKGGRKDQQDRIGVFEARDGSQRLLVVADGMGGHAGGEMAAEAVVEAARKIWQKHVVAPMTPDALLDAVVAEAHVRINEVGAKRGIAPRSTVVLLFANGKVARWAHVGDSRLYHFRKGKLLSRSRDHSVVQMLVDIGKVREDQMGAHPDQNRLTQSLGGERVPQPEIDGAEIAGGDGFVLCSDGLWEQISPKEMASALKQDTLGRAVKELARVAAKRGGGEGDNVAVAVARAFDGQTRSRRNWFGIFNSIGLVVAGFLLLLAILAPAPEAEPRREGDVVVSVAVPPIGPILVRSAEPMGGARPANTVVPVEARR
jgi:serine/threonine protein phosphatase PrpC